MKLLHYLIKLFPAKPVFAHCDIPCGIYDPHRAQMAAHTILRMVDLMSKLQKVGGDEKEYFSSISRHTQVKEEHAEILKTEIRILWADYFKEEHLKDYPNLHDLFFKTLKLASQAKQTVDKDIAMRLLKNVQEIAEIFYKTKNLEPVRVKSPYPTGEDMIFYK